MTLHALSDLQWYPWNLHIIKNVEENVVLLTRDVFTDSRRVYWLETCFFLWISLLHLISKKWEKPRLNNKPFKERNKNIGILHSWSVKAFNGIIIVNRPWWVTSNYAYSPLGKSEINKSHWLEKIIHFLLTAIFFSH